MAVSLRRLGFLLSRRLQQINYASTQHYSRIISDLTRPPVYASQDILLTNLKNCSSSNELLQQIGDHCQIMNNKHLIQAFRTLFAFHKQGRGNVSLKEIANHPSFEKLCHQIKKNAGTLEVNDTVEVLKVLTYMDIKSSSMIMQVLLQIVRHSINDFNLPQMIFLDFLLHHMQSTPLVDALKIAVPIIFETQLPTKMSRDDISHIAEYMHYVSKREVSENCVEFVVASAMKCTDKMTAETAKSLVWSICDMQPDMFFEPLLNKAMSKMLVDMDGMGFYDIETTIAKLLSKYSNRHRFYYNDAFFDLCADMVVYKDLGFEQGIYILKKYWHIGHVNDNLLDYVCSHCVEQPSLILDGNCTHVYALIGSLALTEHIPKDWEIIKKLLRDTKCFESNMQKDFLWLKLCSCLASLDIYKPEVLEKAFDISLLQKVFRRFYINDYENIFLIRQAVQLYRPLLSNLIISDDMIKQLCTRINLSSEYPLEASLIKGLGNEQLVETGLITIDGNLIDHCVVMKNGIAVNIEKYVDTIRNNELPSDCQVVAVLAMKHFHCPLNRPKMLKGTTKLLIRVLEEKGFCVVPINLTSWSSLEDYEKIPYLMQAFDVKTDVKRKLNNQKLP